MDQQAAEEQKLRRASRPIPRLRRGAARPGTTSRRREQRYRDILHSVHAGSKAAPASTRDLFSYARQLVRASGRARQAERRAPARVHGRASAAAAGGARGEDARSIRTFEQVRSCRFRSSGCESSSVPITRSSRSCSARSRPDERAARARSPDRSSPIPSVRMALFEGRPAGRGGQHGSDDRARAPGGRRVAPAAHDRRERGRGARAARRSRRIAAGAVQERMAPASIPMRRSRCACRTAR